MANPLLQVAKACEQMLAGTRHPEAAAPTLGVLVAQALDTCEHGQIYLEQMLESCYNRAESVFYRDPPDRSTLLIIRKACRQFAAAQTEDDACGACFGVMQEWNQKGALYGDAEADTAQETAEQIISAATALQMHELKLDEQDALTDALTDELKVWLEGVALQHIETKLREVIGRIHRGDTGLRQLTSLDLDDLEEVVSELELTEDEGQRFLSGVKVLQLDGTIDSSSITTANRAVPALSVGSEQEAEGDAAYARAHRHRENHMHVDAVKEYTVALDKGTKNRFKGLIERGLCYADTEQHQEAFDDFDRLCKEEPTNTYAWNNRGWKHMHFGRLEDAKTDLLEALRLKPNNTHANGNLRNCFEKIYGTADDGAIQVALRSAVNSQPQSSTGFVGLANQGATCYLNSLLQSLYMTPELRSALYKWQYTDAGVYGGAVDKCIPAQLQRLFVMLQTSEKRAIDTEPLTKAFGWADAQAFEQQDVQELFNQLFDALEQTLKGSDQEHLISALYEGEMKDYVQCKNCMRENAKVNKFRDLFLTIRPFGATENIKTLDEGLRSYFEAELLDDTNKYFCEHCDAKHDALKGLKLSAVPYILSINLKRFDWDWELDRRVKIDGAVSFPFILNMAQYLDQSNDLSSQELGTAIAAEPSSEYLPCRSNFGKDGADIGPCAASSVAASTLKYELFAILVHSGGALGGHYYGYIKDLGSKKTWINFNDDSITEITEEQVQASYGGQTTASAYMLLYRRLDDALNVGQVTEANLPDGVLEQMQSEQRAAEREREKKIEDRKHRLNQCIMFVVCGEKLLQLHMDKDMTLGSAKDQICEYFGLNVERSQGRCRLHTLDGSTDLPKNVLDSQDDTLLRDCQLDLTETKGDFCVEVRGEESTTWDGFEYGVKAAGTSTYLGAQGMKVRLVQFSLDADKQAHILQTRIVVFKSGGVMRDLRQAAQDLFSIPPDSLRVIRATYYGNDVLDRADECLLSGNTVRLNQGDHVFMRDLSSDTAEFGNIGNIFWTEESQAIDSINLMQLDFTAINGDDFVHHVTFPKRWTIQQLQELVSGQLKMDARKVRMYDSNSEVKQMPHRRRNRLWMRTTSELVTVPIYLWTGSEDTIDFLFNMNVEETWLVTELKSALAKKLKSDASIDMDPTCMRVREVGVNIFRDEQTVIDAVIKFAGDEKLAVCSLDAAEPKCLPSHKVVTCMHFKQEDYAVGRTIEVVVTDRAECDEFRRQVAQLSDIPHEHVGIARRRLYGVHTLIDIPNLSWDTDRAPAVVDALGYTQHPETTLAYPKDGDLYYFRDNRENLKQLTEAEHAELLKVEQAVISAKTTARRPEPKGVTINIESHVSPRAAAAAAAQNECGPDADATASCVPLNDGTCPPVDLLPSADQAEPCTNVSDGSDFNGIDKPAVPPTDVVS